ncbi:uncharacterized protein LOC105663464 [Megachile rotundata]|uniref:uncharacterized protein LOC105663464 n=1 Tax=Megachile rotundata TaxID=143995 RepID=UPI000614B380|nr:PREDICTED: uncharacterized protein LOC105663464 [Megachile rotundata]
MTSSVKWNKLQLLNRQRDNAKDQVARILLSLLEDPEMSTGALMARRSKLDQMYNTFSKTQTEIEVNDGVSNHAEEWQSFNNQFFKAMEIINNQKVITTENYRAAPSYKVPDSSSTVKPTSSILRKIEITPFNGNPINWHSFHDIFKSSVHDDKELIGLEKFHLLKNALCGEVSAIVESLEASESNYLVAWDLLCKRYNNPRNIINAHLKHLFDLPETTQPTALNLIQLAEQAQVHFNALQAVSNPTELWNTFLIHVVASKLGKNVRDRWERTLKNEEVPTFKQLLNFINKLACEAIMGQENLNTLNTPVTQDILHLKTQVHDQVYGETDKKRLKTSN